MSKVFNPNPIIIVDNGKVVDVVELDYSYLDFDFNLKIISKDDEVLYDDLVNENTKIKIDVSIGEASIIYQDIVTKKEILRKKIIVSDYDISEKVLSSQKKEELGKKEFKEISEFVKEKLDNPLGSANEVETHTEMLTKATMDDQAREYTETKIKQTIKKNFKLNDKKLLEYSKKIYANYYGMGVLQELDDDEEIGEILVNGFIHPEFRCDIYYIKNQKKYRYDKVFKTLNDLKNVYSRAIAFSKQELNNIENAMVEAIRANRDRVNIVIPDASESWALNIRKFGNFIPTAKNMKEFGTVNDEIERLLKVLVKGKTNIGIGGEMGTGKTTFINYLLSYTKPMERKCVIASVAETDVERALKGHDILIFNVNTDKGFTFSKLVRTALRTTSDRIIIPESRGDEFKQVYEANLKTKGNMFTAHALTDYEFMDMCVDMYVGDSANSNLINIKNKIAKAVNIIIIMRKVGSSIRIKSISEVILDENKNFKEMHPLYIWKSDPEDYTKGEYVRTNYRLSDDIKERMTEYGVPLSKMKGL